MHFLAEVTTFETSCRDCNSRDRPDIFLKHIRGKLRFVVLKKVQDKNQIDWLVLFMSVLVMNGEW